MFCFLSWCFLCFLVRKTSFFLLYNEKVQKDKQQCASFWTFPILFGCPLNGENSYRRSVLSPISKAFALGNTFISISTIGFTVGGISLPIICTPMAITGTIVSFFK